MTRLVQAAGMGAFVLCVLASGARGDVASDQAGAILIFPKIVVDTSTPPKTKRGPIDTLIRISNTSARPIAMSCFYINANGHCHNTPGTICDPYHRDASNLCAAGDFCEAGWHETDFTVTLSPRQPIAWLASVGAAPCEIPPTGLPCFPALIISGQPPNLIQPVSEDPFIGELKCIEVDFSGVPVARNDLKGEAEIIRSRTAPDVLDVEAYNAIGIPAVLGNNDGDSTLVLGGGVCVGGSRDGLACTSGLACPRGRCSAEYSGCPNVLILDHFFDGAIDPISMKAVTTTLTLVPCTEDFNSQPVPILVQVLVFNEFEQRFSSRLTVTCFRDIVLTDIDGSTPDRSIFSASVMGTLTGQTRFRGVVGKDPRYGYTLLGIAEEFRKGGGTAAFNLHFQGSRPDSDYVYLPEQQ